MKKIGLTKRRFSKSFKHSVQKKILSGSITGVEACTIYGVSRSTMYRWIGELSISNSDLSNMEEDKSESKELLESRIKELEKALELAELKSEAYKRLIIKAESKFKISIEKKSGPK